MFCPTTLLTIALALAVRAQDQGGGEAQARETKQTASLASLARVEAWPEVLARDALISFSVRTSSSALAVLTRAESGESQKAAALIALGCARIASERPRLESFADEGTPVIRHAAILALGEMKSGDIGNLVDLAGRKGSAIASCGLLALVRNGSADALDHVREVANDANNPLAADAKEFLAFHDDANAGANNDLVRTLYELRFAAARDHGLVHGQVWRVLVLDELCHNRAFLGRVIYRGASELDRPGIRDHFLEIALDQTLPERWRGVVNAMPTELSTMIENRLITPADDKDWSAIVAEIDRRKLEGFTEPILRRAFQTPSLRGQAAALLARGGSKGSVQLLQSGIESDDPNERALCVEALGATGKDEYLPSVSELAEDNAAQVRAAAVVAEIRLGSTTALDKLRKRLGADTPKKKDDRSTADDSAAPRPTDPDAHALIEALSRAARDPHVAQLLSDLLPDLEAGDRAKAAVALLEIGRADARGIVRGWLRDRRPSGVLAARAIAALSSHPSLEDIDVLHDLLPYDDDMDVNVELACALLRLRDPMVTPILRVALWTEPWNRSVLAGALWVDALGIDSLRLEIEHPPQGSDATDQRRVGFALGEWGGLDEVERLSARRSAGDPAVEGAMLGALGARTH